MSAASDARGLKRVCVSCGIRFYDFNKRPIECPNCDTQFTGELKVKGRRTKAAIVADLEKEKPGGKKAKLVGNDNTEEIEAEDGVVSLQDLDEGDTDDLDDDAALTEIEDVGELEDEAIEVVVEEKE
ncbi:MAG: FYDLN acid domain-containing protein [Alphaproteobacteria bacterium]